MIQSPGWWLFLALMPMAYWLSPIAIRPLLLGLASVMSLVILAPVGMFVMLALAGAVYGAYQVPVRTRTPAFAGAAGAAGASGAPYAERPDHPRTFGVPVLAVLAYLIWYKYVPAVAGTFAPGATLATLAAPIGCSYYSFKLMHYALERGRGTLPAHTLADFLSWLFLLPTFTAGPIERLDHYLANRQTHFQPSFLVEGGTRIIQGLIKKFILSAVVTMVCLRITGPNMLTFLDGATGWHGALKIWSFLVLALVALYLDFAAYSDIAIGASRVFGLKITENFDYPFLATNLTDFWRRWHMSLTGWCRAYIYMPLVGTTRNPPAAIVATFAVVGLWHAGTVHWLAWGLWHGVGQAGVQLWARYAQRRRWKLFKTRVGRAVGWVLTMGYVSLGGALVAFYPNGSLIDSFRLMSRAFGL